MTPSFNISSVIQNENYTLFLATFNHLAQALLTPTLAEPP